MKNLDLELPFCEQTPAHFFYEEICLKHGPENISAVLNDADQTRVFVVVEDLTNSMVGSLPRTYRGLPVIVIEDTLSRH